MFERIKMYLQTALKDAEYERIRELETELEKYVGYESALVANEVRLNAALQDAHQKIAAYENTLGQIAALEGSEGMTDALFTETVLNYLNLFHIDV